MDIKDILGSGFVEVEGGAWIRVHAKIPFLGKRELVEFRLSGFEDKDDDGVPEFSVDLEFMDKDVLPKDFKIELPDPTLLMSALGGSSAAASTIVGIIVNTAKERGIELPFSS